MRVTEGRVAVRDKDDVDVGAIARLDSVCDLERVLPVGATVVLNA